jgi:hypothetical protein
MHKTHKRALILLATPLVALSIACGSGTTTKSGGDSSAKPGGSGATATPAITTVPIGQALTLNRDILGTKTVATITVSNLRVGVDSGNQFMTAEKGQYIVVDVAVQVAEGKFSLTQGSFKLVAADGTVFDTTMPVVKPDLGYSDLAPGQKTSGAITFDAAVGAEKGGKIALTDVLAKSDAGYWTL